MRELLSSGFVLQTQMMIRNKKYKAGIRCPIPRHSKMCDLVLRLAGDATVRGMTTRDDMQVFSAFDFIGLVCKKTGAYSRQVWKSLIDTDSIFKKEIEFTMEFSEYHYGIHRNTRVRQNPMMTLRALHPLSDSTPYQDVRPGAEARGRCDCQGRHHT